MTNLATDPETVRYYRNRTWNADGTSGQTGNFLEWTQQVGLKDVGTLLARGSAQGDYDNDGDPDFAINQIGGNLVLLAEQRRAGQLAAWSTWAASIPARS